MQMKFVKRHQAVLRASVRKSMLIQFHGRPSNDAKFAQTLGDVMLKLEVHNGVNSVSRLP